MRKIYDYMFPIIGLEERIKEWCEIHEKDISFGKNMTHYKLDKIGFPKRKIFGIFVYVSFINGK